MTAARVFVYWNLHKSLWSVRDCKTRKVIAHLHSLTLIDVKFKVSEAGRQRVLREQRKNVHAGVEGYVSVDTDNPCLIPVRYNPYELSSFEASGRPIYEAPRAQFHPDRRVTI